MGVLKTYTSSTIKVVKESERAEEGDGKEAWGRGGVERKGRSGRVSVSVRER